MEVEGSQLDLPEVMIFIKKMETYISKDVSMISLSLPEKDDKEYMEKVLLERPIYYSTLNTKLTILITSEQLKEEESIGTNGLVIFFGIRRKRGEVVDKERSLYFKYVPFKRRLRLDSTFSKKFDTQFLQHLLNKEKTYGILIIGDQKMQSYIVFGTL
ncbi:hypothetical protein V6N13_014445 [Hibiscus sabdariffa]|uniref:Uncharacterized protein n=1 Tax=Hibiscus sabdariffa TaxID=183260 RepID=A0ABR2RVP2_9ROSI